MWMFIFLVLLPGALLSIPALVLFIEVLAALPRRSEYASISSGRTKRVAIIVPAHNESAGLLPTLCDLQGQLAAGDRIVVVADNCSDDTAAIGRQAGAEVVVRCDASRIGKGYALSAGMQYLESDPPDFVLFCDADCRVQAELIDRLAAECERSSRPVQSCYVMRPAAGASADQIFAEFAWMLKNLVRPLGLRNFGGPCQLMGTGMIFPWDLISGVQLASANLVEDLQLGLDLAMIGNPPIFMPSAVTTSVFPTSASGADTQRKRWVQGHLAVVGKQLPRLLGGAVRRGDANLLALALDVAVPPIVLLCGLMIGAWCLAFVALLCGLPSSALLIATTNIFLLVASLALAWVRFGRVTLRMPSLFALAELLWLKAELYVQLARGHKAGHWVRTERALGEPAALLVNNAPSDDSERLKAK